MYSAGCSGRQRQVHIQRQANRYAGTFRAGILVAILTFVVDVAHGFNAFRFMSVSGRPAAPAFAFGDYAGASMCLYSWSNVSNAGLLRRCHARCSVQGIDAGVISP